MSGLTDDDIRQALAELPGWEYDGAAISKRYKFGSFREAIDFINRIADKADAADHHPDLENHYDTVVVSLRTWSADSVTGNDVALAREIEAVAG